MHYKVSIQRVSIENKDINYVCIDLAPLWFSIDDMSAKIKKKVDQCLKL